MGQAKTGVEVLFYDRKHNCTVKASQLMTIVLGTSYVAVDPNDSLPTGFDFSPDTGAMWPHGVVLGELGYRSETCPSHTNWDRWLMHSDLVFLRCEEV